jgi:hypothetical protein
MWKYLTGAAGVGLLAFALWLGYRNAMSASFERGRASVAAEVNKATVEAYSRGIAAQDKQVAETAIKVEQHIIWRDRWLTPAKETIIKRITQYAETPMGRDICFDADSVRAANQDIATANALAHPAAAARSEGGLSTIAGDRNGSGRDGDPGPSPPVDRAIISGFGGVRQEAETGDRHMAEELIAEEGD